MNPQEKVLELEDERQREKQYQKVLADRAKTIGQFEGPANLRILGQTPARRNYPNTFVGRVALTRADNEILGGAADFYIGETYAVVDGINVFGWANPIACTFFRGADHHYLCRDVAVVRAFSRDSNEIIDFVDEYIGRDAPAPPFARKGRVYFPAPPVSPKLRSAQTPGPTSEPEKRFRGANSDIRSGNSRADFPPIRAEALLREQMLAPRAQSLSPVLSTLQPDQFELVAVPAMGSIIIEGQPGTGKTIVASHRAAYLVNEDTPLEKKVLGKVLVVGPTHGYSRHVRPLIARLSGNSNKIIVLSLAELSELIVGAKQGQELGSSSEYPRFPAQLAKVVRSAVVRRTARSLANRPVRPFQVYEYLRSSDDITRLHPKWTSYRRQLPPYREALGAQAYAPLITFIHWEIEKPDVLRNVQHVILDEAQDLTPLEWVLLDEINFAHHWTILGDLNQRRTNGTPASWREVLDAIKIPRDTPVRTMRRAYRSTRPILEYANQLVPRAQRQAFAFQQDGPYPRVHQVRESDLGNFAAKELERLSDTYPSGTVVAICQTPGIIEVWLRLNGWINDAGEGGVWTRNGRSVSVFVPDGIRGLEFDGVVVVEPARFPTQHGCLGTLYTALTRANRELSVVHAASLPESLKPPAFG